MSFILSVLLCISSVALVVSSLINRTESSSNKSMKVMYISAIILVLTIGTDLMLEQYFYRTQMPDIEPQANAECYINEVIDPSSLVVVKSGGKSSLYYQTKIISASWVSDGSCDGIEQNILKSEYKVTDPNRVGDTLKVIVKHRGSTYTKFEYDSTVVYVEVK